MNFKAYDPKEIESKWHNRWKENNCHKTGGDSDKPKFYCLDMFPYPSGDGIHVGHWRGYVLSDVWSRYKKLQGYNVLHPMGWDAFGLPAENDAIKKGIHPETSTQRNIANFKRQLTEMGAMYDWDKEVNTSSPGPPEQDSDWNDTGIEGVYRFLTRVWAIAMKSIEYNPVSKPDVVKETHKLVKGVVERLENQKVNTVISLFMSYVNYIGKEHPEGLDKDCLSKFITLLAPFVPHFAEEIWEAMGNKRSIFETGHWPVYDPNIIEELTIEIPVQINGRVRDTIVIERNTPEAEAIKKAKSSEIIKSYMEGKSIYKEFYIPQKVINFVVKGIEYS